MAEKRANRIPFDLSIFTQSAEFGIPLSGESIDTVVLTWTLCSINNPAAALNEMRRVMKRNGKLIFIEHGSAPDARVRALQNSLTPTWTPCRRMSP